MKKTSQDRLARSLLVFFSVLVALLLGVFPARASQSAQPGAAEQPFSVPQWLSFRIRLDDTLTSKYSMEGDPFSATVLDRGKYQGARVYGTIQTIDNSGRFRGHTTMILVFNRLVMPDGRRAPIAAEIVRLYHAPSGESVDVEGAIESGGRGKKSFINTGLGAGAGALLGGIFGGGRGAGLGSVIGGIGGLGTTGFTGPQVIVLSRGLEMLIRVTGPGAPPPSNP
ncbi:MAG TPA: hypothetical protein VMJ93_17340 [Verrucomicrobiae bacterium]|nr:hypothetical protein [Verrucomicrobiae bacterium]